MESELSNFGKNIRTAKIFVVGFAFKGEPENSDMRDSTTVWFVEHLKKKTQNIFGYDPVVSASELGAYCGIRGVEFDEGIKDCDAVLFMNNHRSYIDMDPVEFTQFMNRPAFLYDAWQMFMPIVVQNIEGICYEGVGF